MTKRTLVSVVLTAILALSMATTAFAQDGPAVEVSDQPVVDGTVTIASVSSEGPGWLVIHADADGKPGPVIGYTAVATGPNADVVVDIDTDGATPVLHAMLHIDEGTVGTYEFPGPDAPARVDDAVVNVPFNSDEEMMADEEAADEEAADEEEMAEEESAEEGDMAEEETAAEEEASEEEMAEEEASDEEMADEEMAADGPSLAVSDQESDGTMVTVDSVTADHDGWMVIHADADGSPGPVIGQTGVPAGMTENVIVMLAETLDGETTLWAMLHVDEGEMGTYEFPGADGPVTVDGEVLTLSFVASAPAMMAEEAAAEEEEMAEEESSDEAMAEEETSDEEMAEEETSDEAMAEEEASDEAMMDDDAKGHDEEMMDEGAKGHDDGMMDEGAKGDDGMMEGETKGGTPAHMPDTGTSPISAPISIAMVILGVVALAGGTFVTRRRQV